MNELYAYLEEHPVPANHRRAQGLHDEYDRLWTFSVYGVRENGESERLNIGTVRWETTKSDAEQRANTIIANVKRRLGMPRNAPVQRELYRGGRRIGSWG